MVERGSRNGSRLPAAARLWASVTAGCIGLHLFPGVGARFGWRAPPDGNAPWTLLTSHFVHLGGAHLAANIAALTIICAAAHVLRQGALLTGLFGAALLVVSLGLVAGPWPIAWYAGLSGVLYGCFGGLALALTAEPAPGRWIGWALLLGSGAKIAMELSAGVGATGALGIPTAPPAHLYGFIGGVATGFTLRSRRRLA
nr:rhombosortase [Zoogloeaceae bacterium]